MTRARDTADTQDNLGGAVAPFVAGKNGFINGGFDIWQRGTSIAGGSFKNYVADRWVQFRTGLTISQQLTNDTTNLPFIQYCARVQRNSGTSGVNSNLMMNSMATNDAISYAGKTVTLSFYARKGADYSATSSGLFATIYSGTGTDQALIDGYTGLVTVVTTTFSLTTTWQRFSITGIIPTTAKELACEFAFTPTGTAGANDYYEITGVQIELGAQATPFARAGGSIGGELALCQRYYYLAASGDAKTICPGAAFSSADNRGAVTFPVTMRTAPTLVATSGTNYYYLEANGAADNFNSFTILRPSTTASVIWNFTESGSTSGVGGTFYTNNAASSVAFNAEL
jgi:hypothetical protein